MTQREVDPRRLDVERFAKDAGTLEGRWPVAGFERLGGGRLADAELAWSARGEWRTPRGLDAQAWLHLRASTRLALECQRCLRPVETDIEVERSFRFVAGEQAAAQIDADSEEDVLALTRALDLAELLEDELLLALPLVPRHDSCPVPLVPAADAGVPEAAEARANPFAVLQSLKRGSAG